VPTVSGCIEPLIVWAATKREATLMTIRDLSHSDKQTEPRAELLETCWQMRSPSGKVFECAVYRAGIGLELRISYDNEAWSRAALARIEEGRARAAKLKGIVLQKGGFQELAG